MLDQLINNNLSKITNLRRRLHRIPELAFEEVKTAQCIREELDRLGIDFIAGVENAPTATVAIIGDANKPCVALRADIDALPIIEQTNAEHASTHPGKMHACGHDGHSATLVGVASILNSIADQLPVCVKLIWQPAEEFGGGAERLVKAGVLDGRVGPKVSAIFGLHGWPGLRLGMVATKPGTLLAATDNFAAEFVGAGCHGAYPHLGVDPIAAVCEAVTSLQKTISREIDPTDSAVITIGLLHAGTAVNIIPDIAKIEATVRTLTDPTRRRIHQLIDRRLNGIAAANGCKLNLKWTEGYPATINDPAMADYVAKIARQALGQDRFFPASKPSMGGEDFAYYLEKVPGCFFLVGVQPSDDPYPPLHSDRYDFADPALAIGMRMFVELARNFGKKD
ncbi:MAG TPA: M20 family metallopeptidase [Tepidisphaeraceae bacterium]|jgi:amidohydrolase